jgi:rhodanese-related sulfurtransferase
MQQLSVRDLAARLAAPGRPPLLLDVREPWEVALCALPGSTVIPMGQIPARLDELDPARETVVICHHGVRSLRVAHFLETRGFTNLHNLRGGIDAWAREVDLAMQTY